MRATKQQLIEAKALIQDKKNWTRNAFARDREGNQRDANEKAACSFCAMGALARVLDLDVLGSSRDAGEALVAGALRLGYLSPEALNDHAGHAAVMHMYKLAIEETQE